MAKLPLVRGQITRKELEELLGREVAVGSPLEELHEVLTTSPDVVARFELVEGEAEMYERTR